MNMEESENYRMPDGFEDINPDLDIEEERTLARDGSAAFPGQWVLGASSLLVKLKTSDEM